MTSNSAEDGITNLTYEAALAELDTLITKLEGGSIALDEAIGAYERGVVLAQHCSDLLERTEQRVKQLVVSASGALGERPLEAAVAPAAETRAEPVAVTPVTPAAMRPPVPRIDPDDVPF
jgi:exodeoxyribonuclease VII small subunit